jgi:hypothetical protein
MIYDQYPQTTTVEDDQAHLVGLLELLDKAEFTELDQNETLQLHTEALKLVAIRERVIDGNGRPRSSEYYAYFPGEGDEFMPLEQNYGRRLALYKKQELTEELRLNLIDLSKLELERPVVIHEDAYKVVKDFVRSQDAMSAEYLHAHQGFTETQAKAIFEQLQADGIVDKVYSPNFGFKVKHEEAGSAAPVERRNRLFGRRALEMTFAQTQAQAKRAEAEQSWENSRQQKLIITTSPITLQEYLEEQMNEHDRAKHIVSTEQRRISIVRETMATQSNSNNGTRPQQDHNDQSNSSQRASSTGTRPTKTEAPTYSLSEEDAANEDIKALFKPHNLKRLSDDIAEEIRSDVTAYKKSNGIEQSIQLDDPVFAVIRDAAKQRVLESTIMNATKAPNANQETVDGLRDAQYEYDLGRKRNAKRKR